MDKILYCGNCKKIIGENDKFCKYCGKKATYLQRIDREAMIGSVIYGPPYSAKYVCRKCGKVYVERGLGSAGTRYCVDCGEKINPIAKEI